ncbi:hypothetical protein MDAP_000643 [Mitosporidium daphniae]
MESGKTRLFLEIQDHIFNMKSPKLQTVCSMAENTIDSHVSIVDVPGHSKLCPNIIRKYSNAACSLSLVVCIDISSLATGLKSSSRFLLQTLLQVAETELYPRASIPMRVYLNFNCFSKENMLSPKLVSSLLGAEITRQAKFQLASTELSSSTISADHGSVDESFFLYSRYPPSKRSIDEIRACFERVTEMILQDVLTPEGSIPAITFGQITNEDKDTLSHKHLFAWIWKK